MNLSDDQIFGIFFELDEFYKDFKPQFEKLCLKDSGKRPYSKRKLILSYSEVMTIVVAFHLSGARCLKHYYINYIQKHLSHLFPNTCSYNRFVELESHVFLPLAYYLQNHGTGECSGLSFIDSTRLKVCHNKRIKRNKVFKHIAEIGKSTMGWFFGFKLHLVINEVGEIINFVVTKGNCDDRNDMVMKPIIKGIFAKVYGDKGYISAKLFDWLFSDGIQIITQIRNNMKNKLMPLKDKIMLRKRSIIETVNDELKNICQIEHSRHRSPKNFLVNLVAGMIAYNFLPKKPKLNLVYEEYQPQLFLQLSSN